MQIQVRTPWTCSEKIMRHNLSVMRDYWSADFISQGWSNIACDGEGDNFCSGREDHRQWQGNLDILFPGDSEKATA